MLEMTSNALTNAEKDVTTNFACVRSFTNNPFFRLGQIRLCVIMLRNFPPFVGQNVNQMVQQTDTSILNTMAVIYCLHVCLQFFKVPIRTTISRLTA